MSLLTENSAFFLSLSTLFFAFITLAVRYCYSSKCSNVECGPFKCIRNVEIEEKETEFRIEHNSNSVEKENQP